jgi:hypothetical protein
MLVLTACFRQPRSSFQFAATSPLALRDQESDTESLVAAQASSEDSQAGRGQCLSRAIVQFPCYVPPLVILKLQESPRKVTQVRVTSPKFLSTELHLRFEYPSTFDNVLRSRATLAQFASLDVGVRNPTLFATR